jgi:DNA transposition AAA+ family ATPase
MMASPLRTFIATKEHRRFVEFANAVRKYRYIGLCHGSAGVGKTLSARRYAHWDKADPLLVEWGPRAPSDTRVYAALARSRTVFYTPTVGATIKGLREELRALFGRVAACIEQSEAFRAESAGRSGHATVDLLVIDEVERLSHSALEHVRDMFDRSQMGLILIGMPGIEKRLARYPQL